MEVITAYMKILEKFKSEEEKLDPADKEKLRTVMLSYLLFESTTTSGVSRNTNKGIAGLSDKEKELIWKLASNTDALHRLMKDGNAGDQ